MTEMKVFKTFEGIPHTAVRLVEDYLKKTYGEFTPVSAKTGQGLDDLKQAVLEFIRKQYQELVLAIHAGLGKLIAFVEQRSNIIERSYDGDSVILKVLIENRHADELRKNPNVSVIVQ